MVLQLFNYTIFTWLFSNLKTILSNNFQKLIFQKLAIVQTIFIISQFNLIFIYELIYSNDSTIYSTIIQVFARGYFRI